MKRTMVIATLVVAAWILNSTAQDSGLQGGSATHKLGDNSGGQSGQGGQHQKPSPEQIAAHLMEKFDANKDGELTQDELTQALEALRAHHPQEGGQGGGQGGATGGTSKGGKGGHSQGAANAGGQQGGGQGASGEHKGPPPADKVATQMIEKFAADKKGLKQAELVQALEAHKANRGKQGGEGQQGAGSK